jgi:hypothetical protein
MLVKCLELRLQVRKPRNSALFHQPKPFSVQQIPDKGGAVLAGAS